jgi:hypothetical protein
MNKHPTVTLDWRRLLGFDQVTDRREDVRAARITSKIGGKIGGKGGRKLGRG